LRRPALFDEGGEDSFSVVNISEAKTQLSKIIERVEQGNELTIARNNEPVAVISAARKSIDGTMGGRRS
jgi:prevent-host-death family protein